MDVFLLLHKAIDRNASDLQLIAGNPPLIRIYGDLVPCEGYGMLTTPDIQQAFDQLATPEERERFTDEMELDFGYSIEGEVRLRCNVARQLNGLSIAIRILPPRVMSIDELGLPQIFKKFVQQPRGLVILSGPTGSGKTTSMAAMLHHLNELGGYHIVTVEDPIEYVHNRIASAITQRQLGVHTTTYSRALKHVLRQNPDVIMVGEVRDLETAASVLTLAETGHLVLTTSHAPSAPQAIERIVDMFPLAERHLSEIRLASLLVAIVCQTLLPRASGSGLIAAVEILTGSDAVRNLIREGKVYQLPNIIRTHRDEGMVSLDESMVDLYSRQLINYETLVSCCRDRNEIAKLLQRMESEKPERTQEKSVKSGVK
jgi:twitching motility protein PilT